MKNCKTRDKRLLRTMCPNCNTKCHLKPIGRPEEDRAVFDCSNGCNIEFDENKHWL